MTGRSTGPYPEMRIGLVWHTVNSGNLGVGALTAGHIGIVTKAALDANVSPRFVIFEGKQAGERYIWEADEVVGLTNLELLLPHRYFRRIRSVDCLLDIGEGDGFSDIYGLKRYLRQIATKVIAKIAGTPYLVAPQTVGPFKSHVTRLLARLALSGVHAVSVRDDESAKLIVRISSATRPLTTTDVAFAMDADPVTLPVSDRVRIGLNISGLLYNQRSREYGIQTGYDYHKLVHEIAAYLESSDRFEVHLFGHVFSSDPIDNDGDVLHAFSARYPSFIVAPKFSAPWEAKSYIGAMDAVIASRMHACIASLSAGVPVIPVSYSPKFENLFLALGYPWTIPHRGVSDEEALRILVVALSDLPAMKRDVQIARSEASRRLAAYQQMLTFFLSDVRRA